MTYVPENGEYPRTRAFLTASGPMRADQSFWRLRLLLSFDNRPWSENAMFQRRPWRGYAC